MLNLPAARTPATALTEILIRMKLRSLLPLLLLAMPCALPGQDTGPAAAQRRGRAGRRPVGNGRPAFQRVPRQPQSQRPRTKPKWPSASPKHGSATANRPKPSPCSASRLSRNIPAAPFWKGQALAGLGRFTEALATFAPLLENPAAPHRNETGFTMASLQLALGQPEAALATLATLTRTPDDALTAKARLHQVEILLDLGRPPKRAKPCPPQLPSARRAPARDFPRSPSAPRRRPPGGCRSQFPIPHRSTARPVPPPLPCCGRRPRRRPPAPRELPDAATSFLLSFIQDHPDSPLLEELFQRLLDGLPDTPVADGSHPRTPGPMDHSLRTHRHRRDQHPGFQRRRGMAQHSPPPTNCSPSRSSPVRWDSTASLHPRPAPRPGDSSPASALKTPTTSSPTAPSSKPPAGRWTRERPTVPSACSTPSGKPPIAACMRGEAAFLEARIRLRARRQESGHPAVR